MRYGRLCLIVVGFSCWSQAFAADPTSQATEKTVRPTIAVFHLDGILLERPPAVQFGFDLETRTSLHSLLKRLDRAARDPNLKALVLTADGPALGWAQMQELRAAIRRVRQADKRVDCYLEEADATVYQLATAASRICLAPAGELRVAGIHSETAYLKGLLDKVRLEADIEHVGAYKGAGEPFTRTGPSDEVKEMLQWLIQDLFDQMVATIAEGRGLSVEDVRSLIDRGPFNADEALDARLVDAVLDADAFLTSLKDEFGPEVELSHRYGDEKSKGIDFSNPLAFFKLFGESFSKKKKTSKPTVMVVYVDGIIVPGKTDPGLFGESDTTGSTTIRRALTAARWDPNVKAVVLRVDSPGGSALASDIMWRATRQLVEAKPVVVSMGNVAASGGYYLSVSAPVLFAEPATITGSIGVLGGKLVTKGLWDWLGVSFHELSLGRNADLLNTNRRFDERQRAVIRAQLEHVYAMFTDRVRQGRQDRLKDDLERLAGGRVFTGRQALSRGMVDRLGGLHEAIAFAAERAGVCDYEVRTMPEPRGFFDVFMESLTGTEGQEEGADKSVRTGPARGLQHLPAVRELMSVLRYADPWRARAVSRILQRLCLLQQESVLLVMPDELLVR